MVTSSPQKARKAVQQAYPELTVEDHPVVIRFKLAGEEVLDVIKQNVQSEVRPRSTRLKSSSIALDHPLVKAGSKMGRSYYGSPTTSDKALMSFPALKMGPGDSARSHTADEFIFVDEIKEGIKLYIQLLKEVVGGG